MPFAWPPTFQRIHAGDEWLTQPVEELAKKYATVEQHGWYENLEPTHEELAGAAACDPRSATQARDHEELATVERGVFDQLMALNGRYAQLWRLQFDGYAHRTAGQPARCSLRAPR